MLRHTQVFVCVYSFLKKSHSFSFHWHIQFFFFPALCQCRCQCLAKLETIPVPLAWTCCEAGWDTAQYDWYVAGQQGERKPDWKNVAGCPLAALPLKQTGRQASPTVTVPLSSPQKKNKPLDSPQTSAGHRRRLLLLTASPFSFACFLWQRIRCFARPQVYCQVFGSAKSLPHVSKQSLRLQNAHKGFHPSSRKSCTSRLPNTTAGKTIPARGNEGKDQLPKFTYSLCYYWSHRPCDSTLRSGID